MDLYWFILYIYIYIYIYMDLYGFMRVWQFCMRFVCIYMRFMRNCMRIYVYLCVNIHFYSIYMRFCVKVTDFNFWIQDFLFDWYIKFSFSLHLEQSATGKMTAVTVWSFQVFHETLSLICKLHEVMRFFSKTNFSSFFINDDFLFEWQTGIGSYSLTSFIN